MTLFKIECEENCGNAPKKEVLRDFTISLVKKEISFCIELLKDNIIWEFVGDKQLQGKDQVEQLLTQWNNENILELHIHNIITHGNTASLNGTLVLAEQQKIAFCNVYLFAGFGKNAKIKKITSYIIRTKE